ncbi:unnamed protein product [Adineta steineri]|uniref:Ferroptosis suppressor protein 1 n=1 Tax=Adineta steineri TaxID=433720 RepID=A0A815DS88_9BILA|nr:unnamed protein product [Adineta steineri]
MGITGSRENKEKKPVVLIVGGGYGGVQCAKALDKTGHFFVVLIDRKSYFFHNIAALRASVEPNYAQQILIPYDRLLTNGCVVQAEVEVISPDGVKVHGREEPIQFDYLVIATGSSYAFPGKVAETQQPQALAHYDNLRHKIEQAKRILIIGGGPVGIELAGEIATDFPLKDITLVHSSTTLLYPNVFKQELYTRLQEGLERLGVKVVLNDRVDLGTTTYAHQHEKFIEGDQTFLTTKGKIDIKTDLTFVCTGAHVNNKSLKAGPLVAELDPNKEGRLNVNEYLQVKGYTNIFAIGDISSKEDKLAFLAGKQAEYVASFITRVELKKGMPEEYRPLKYPGMFVTLGRNGGAGQMPSKGAMIFGSTIVKYAKSKGMFTSQQWSSLNQKMNQAIRSTDTKQPDHNSGYEKKLNSLKHSMELTEDDARQLLAGLPAKELELGQDFI